MVREKLFVIETGFGARFCRVGVVREKLFVIETGFGARFSLRCIASVDVARTTPRDRMMAMSRPQILTQAFGDQSERGGIGGDSVEIHIISVSRRTTGH